MQNDGGVIKKLLVAGDGWELPQKDDKVVGMPLPQPCLKERHMCFDALHDAHALCPQ